MEENVRSILVYLYSITMTIPTLHGFGVHGGETELMSQQYFLSLSEEDRSLYLKLYLKVKNIKVDVIMHVSLSILGVVIFKGNNLQINHD